MDFLGKGILILCVPNLPTIPTSLSLSLSDRNVNRINRSTVLPRYVTPEAFEEYRLAALDMGFSYCASGPLVRSSYKAGEFFLEHMLADPNSRPCPPPPADHPVLQG